MAKCVACVVIRVPLDTGFALGDERLIVRIGTLADLTRVFPVISGPEACTI